MTRSPIFQRPAIDLGAELDDLAGDIGAGDHGQRRLQPGNAPEDHGVEAVEGHRAHAQQHLRRAGLGIGDILVAQIVEGPVFVKYCRLHRYDRPSEFV